MLLKVIIIGGGIGGLTLARACLDVGIPVEVYEKRSLPEMLSGPGGIFIQRNAMRVYKLLWGGQIYDRFGYFDVGLGRFSFYAFANASVGGTDRAEGGALNVLRSRFSSYANPVPAILEALTNHPIYRDDIYDREPLGQVWGRGRVTPIGDAAHLVQPSIGQGGCTVCLVS